MKSSSNTSLSSSLTPPVTALIFIVVILTGCNTIDKNKVKILEPRGNVPPPYLDPSYDVSETADNIGIVENTANKTQPASKALTKSPQKRTSDVIKPVMNLSDIVPIRNTIIEEPVSQKPIKRPVPDTAPKITPVKIVPDTLPTVSEVKPITYTVKKGDSLWAIARMYGVTSQEIASENNINGSQILKIGTSLTIPPGGKFIPANERPVVKKKEKRKKISKIEGKSVPASGIYTVVKGDSLWKIGRKFNLRVDKIKKLNGLKSNRLDIGQTLILTPIAEENNQPPGSSQATMPQSENSYPEFNSSETDSPTTEVDVTINVPDSSKNKSSIKKPSKFKNLPHYIAGSDTLESISEMYGSKVEWILESNPAIKSNEDLAAGIEIQVPCPDIN